jgi:hypothetical protein
LEKLFNELKSKKNTYEILNCGVSGFSPILEIVLYEQIVKKYSPDFVVMAVFRNDVDDFPAHKKYYKIRENTVSIDYQSPRQNWRAGLFDEIMWKLNTARILFYTLNLIKEPKVSEQSQGSIDVAISGTMDVLKAFNDELANDKAKFCIIYFTNLPALLTPKNDVVGAVFLRKLNEFCLRNNISFLDTSSYLAKSEPISLYYKVDGHLTPRGHEVTATAAFEFIKPLLSE